MRQPLGESAKQRTYIEKWLAPTGVVMSGITVACCVMGTLAKKASALAGGPGSCRSSVSPGTTTGCMRSSFYFFDFSTEGDWTGLLMTKPLNLFEYLGGAT